MPCSFSSRRACARRARCSVSVKLANLLRMILSHPGYRLANLTLTTTATLRAASRPKVQPRFDPIRPRRPSFTDEDLRCPRYRLYRDRRRLTLDWPLGNGVL